MINNFEKQYGELERNAISCAGVTDECISDLKSSGFDVEAYFMENQEDSVALLH